MALMKKGEARARGGGWYIENEALTDCEGTKHRRSVPTPVWYSEKPPSKRILKAASRNNKEVYAAPERKELPNGREFSL
jgi:hypothetical protein